MFLLVVVVVAALGGFVPAFVCRDLRVPARQLVLHAAVLRVHDLRGREPARAVIFLARRRGGELAGRDRVAPHRRRGAGARRSRDARRARAARCRRRTTRSRSSSHSCRSRSTPSTSPCWRGSPTARWTCSRRAGATGAGASRRRRSSSSRCTAPRCWCCRATTLGDDDLEVLQAFAGQVAIAVQQRELRADAERAEGLAEANELRTALLAAVSHDLRTPLSSIKASVTSLLQRDVDFTPDGDAASCSRPSTRAPTGSTTSSATCST